MAKDSKFGTFGGVFTPSLLTILGVIMYLRLPWMAGHTGVVTGLAIVGVAHVISIATGLSISSIATDKNVGAGGPYYIVSRSLGLPIGGALGLALFVGLGFSASLYVIGFSESFLGVFEIERTATAIRITGTITLIVITLVTVISTAFAIKTQYIILTLIGLSLVAIFSGDPHAALPSPDVPPEPKPSLAVLFGIFFPAVTGFTAGVNMSGDLRDPKRSIPTGTMAAIFVGLAVYAGLVLFLTAQVPSEVLVGDPDVLLHIAIRPEPVVAGIWGATLSSGLGSMMGAPRILQALSKDAVTPRVFAKGTGPTSEPRNALIMAFLLAEGGILIAELDAIARIVSMVFLTMYGFLNLSCAIEAAVSPDFRPSFRIPKSVSVVGFAACVMIMVQLDLVAMMGAVALMIGLFLWLQRRQLELESGDAWEGIWASVVRSGLYRLTGGARLQQRNWRPNILAFHEANATGLRGFSEQLITGNGLLTRFTLSEPSKKETAKDINSTEEERKVGIFSRKLRADRPQTFDVVESIVHHYGFSGLDPNTLLLDYELKRQDPSGFSRALEAAANRDFNVLVYAGRSGKTPPNRGPIDVWWQPGAGNVSFSIALLRFITRAQTWEGSALRFLIANPDPTNSDNLRTTMRRILREGRIEGAVKIISTSLDDRPFSEQVRSISQDSRLVVLGLPRVLAGAPDDHDPPWEELLPHLPAALLVRGSSSFPEVLPVGRSAAVSSIPPVPDSRGGQIRLPDLSMPEAKDLASAAREMSEGYQRLVGRLQEQCLRKVAGRHVELIRRILTTAERHLTVDKSFSTSNPKRQRNIFNRLESSLLLESQQRIAEFIEQDLPDLRSIIDGGRDNFLGDDRVVFEEESWLVVRRPAKDFSKHPEDSAYVRRFKRRRRIQAFFSRGQATYRIPLRSLRLYYFQLAKKTLLAHALSELTTETHQLILKLSRILNSTRAELIDRSGNYQALIENQKQQLRDALVDLELETKKRSGKRHWNLIVNALELSQAYADDLSRFDVLPLIQRERRPARAEQEGDELAQVWADNQRRLLERAKLALSMSGVQHRLATIVHRERDSLLLGLKSGAQRECQNVRSQLKALAEGLDQGLEAALRIKLGADGKSQFDPRPITEALLRDCVASLDALPASVQTLTDDAIQGLEEGSRVATETVELPVRRLLQFLIESELVAGLQEKLSQLPRAEQRALSVCQDAARLVSFQLSEFDTADPPTTEDLVLQMRPVVASAIERIDAEAVRLAALSRELQVLLEEKLQAVIDGSHPYELTRASERLLTHIRVQKGQRAVSGLRGWVRSAEQKVRDAMVRLLYQRSEGVLLSQRQKRQVPGAERLVDAVSRFVSARQPQPEVLEALPFYYRQLFLGQSGVNDTFWVGRREEIQRARQAVRAFESGKGGAIFVTGARLSGKSALIQRLTSEVFEKRRVLRVHAPAGGSGESDAFHRALLKAMESAGVVVPGSSNRDPFSVLPRGTVVVIDDLQLFWERSRSAVTITRIKQQIDQHSGRVLFVLGLESHALLLLNRLTHLAERSLAVLSCEPVSAETLQKIITLRHASTGMKFRLDGKDEEELSSLALARYFSALFRAAGGNIGAALRIWITSIKRVRGEGFDLSLPEAADSGVLKRLRPEWLALLVQVFLHKQVTETRLQTISRLDAGALTEQLGTLARTGLIFETQKQVLEIHPAVVRQVQAELAAKGLLP